MRSHLHRLLFDATSRVRAPWRIALFLLGSALVMGVVSLAWTEVDFGSTSGSVLLVLGCGGVLGVAAALVRFFDRRPLATLGLACHSRLRTEVLQGVAAGFALMTFVLGVEWPAGWLEVAVAPLSAGERLTGAAGQLALLAPSAALEELLFRGYALQAAVQWFGGLPAVALSSVLFGVAHNMNPNSDWLSLSNTMLAGVLLAVVYLRSRSLWLPIALHFSWNACQGVLYGLPVSGIELEAPVLVSRLTADGQRLAWLTGGEYGPEGGLVLTVAVVALLALFGRSSHVRPAPEALALWIEAAPEGNGESRVMGEDEAC